MLGFAMLLMLQREAGAGERQTKIINIYRRRFPRPRISRTRDTRPRLPRSLFRAPRLSRSHPRPLPPPSSARLWDISESERVSHPKFYADANSITPIHPTVQFIRRPSLFRFNNPSLFTSRLFYFSRSRALLPSPPVPSSLPSDFSASRPPPSADLLRRSTTTRGIIFSLLVFFRSSGNGL